MNVQRSFQNRSDQGILYLVGTPIGNLEDITMRAVRILKEADWIAAEDTRQTRKLLTHYGIGSRLVSYHDHNKREAGEKLIGYLLDGQSVALVSDAGMPAISDPGYELVASAIGKNIAVIPIPGANAALSALVVSGLSSERFLFVGFLPREKKELRRQLEQLKNEKVTMLFYESPHRIVKTMQAMHEVWGDRQVAIARELTKKFEEITRGTIGECLEMWQDIKPLGEYCIVVEGTKREETSEGNCWWETLSIEQHVQHYFIKLGDRKEAMKRAASDRKMPKREIYRQLHISP